MQTPILNWLRWLIVAFALTTPVAASAQPADKPFSNEQLDQMLAQIALYPDSVGQPYHGYLYRILTAQDAAAPGGAKSYVKGGRMTDGFALVAWSAKYGDAGVMTFIVNQDGVVYQKDLGENTSSAVAAVKAYNPDASWQKATK